MFSEANREAWNAVAALDRWRWDKRVLQWSEQNPRGADGMFHYHPGHTVFDLVSESVEHWVDRGHAAAYASLKPPAVLNMWDFFQLFMYRWFHTGPPKPGQSRYHYGVHAQNVFNARVSALTECQKRHWYFELEGWREKHEDELDAAAAQRWEEEQRAMQSRTAQPAHGPM